MQRRTGFSERYLRYMVTMLRNRGIVKGERGKEYRYRLTLDAFAEHVKVQLVKALENLAKGRGE
jgi:DNA-binding IscR family transcriptional regulator